MATDRLGLANLTPHTLSQAQVQTAMACPQCSALRQKLHQERAMVAELRQQWEKRYSQAMADSRQAIGILREQLLRKGAAEQLLVDDLQQCRRQLLAYQKGAVSCGKDEIVTELLRKSEAAEQARVEEAARKEKLEEKLEQLNLAYEEIAGQRAHMQQELDGLKLARASENRPCADDEIEALRQQVVLNEEDYASEKQEREKLVVENAGQQQTIVLLQQEVDQLKQRILLKDMDCRAEKDARMQLVRWMQQQQRLRMKSDSSAESPLEITRLPDEAWRPRSPDEDLVARRGPPEQPLSSSLPFGHSSTEEQLDSRGWASDGVEGAHHTLPVHFCDRSLIKSTSLGELAAPRTQTQISSEMKKPPHSPLSFINSSLLRINRSGNVYSCRQCKQCARLFSTAIDLQLHLQSGSCSS